MSGKLNGFASSEWMSFWVKKNHWIFCGFNSEIRAKHRKLQHIKIHTLLQPNGITSKYVFLWIFNRANAFLLVKWFPCLAYYLLIFGDHNNWIGSSVLTNNNIDQSPTKEIKRKNHAAFGVGAATKNKKISRKTTFRKLGKSVGKLVYAKMLIMNCIGILNKISHLGMYMYVYVVRVYAPSL